MTGASWTMLLLAPVTFITLVCWIPAPYGRYAQGYPTAPGTASLVPGCRQKSCVAALARSHSLYSLSALPELKELLMERGEAVSRTEECIFREVKAEGSSGV